MTTLLGWSARAIMPLVVAGALIASDFETPNLVGEFGACCLPDNTCVDGFSSDSCESSRRGQFLGVGSVCDKDECPDCDCDGLTDIAEIVNCIDTCIDGGGDPDICAIACDNTGDGVPEPCQDGSLDPDNDGAIGECDGCPDDPDKIEPGVCGCGQADVDDDGDGTLNCNDPCPNDPDNDVDGDGVCGDIDNCPFNPNPDQADSNGDGVGDLCQNCAFDIDCDDDNPCTEDQCNEGNCEHVKQACPVAQICNPLTGECEEGCATNEGCDDEDLCTFDDKCQNGFCFYKPVLCDDGQVCAPLTGECSGCPSGAECSDDLFCNGVETCDDKGVCQPGTDPCTDPKFPFCDEGNDECDECIENTCCGLTDSCLDGVCIQCPQNQACDPNDGQCKFCVDVPSGMCCNSVDGTLVPTDDGDSCTDDVCNPDGSVSHTTFALPPLGSGVGPRTIEIIPQPTDSPRSVAIQLTSPNFPCLLRYVDVDGTIVDQPVFQPLKDWGTLRVTDQDIIPSATGNPTVYEIRAVCDPIDQDTTEPGEAIPFVWGDVTGDNRVELEDILCVLDGFQGRFPNCPFHAVNLAPCIPDDRIDLFDILMVQDAFGGDPFPCASPCGGGACCEPDSTFCLQLSEEECDGLGWFYQGDGQHCRSNPCGLDDQ